MKVLMINSVCGVGSTGRICTDIADELTARGHECKIAFGRKAAPERFGKYAYRISSDTEVKLNALTARLFDNEGFNAKKATKRLISFIEDYNPDVIHLHNLHGYYINVGMLFGYLKKANKKVIWTLHDCWAFTGHCAYFDNPFCEKWKTSCGKCDRKHVYPKAIIDKSKRNFARKKGLFCGVNDLTIVTPSKWLASLVKESFLAEYEVKVINNAIDTSVFRPTESDFRARNNLTDKKIILGVANVWDKSKGLNDFIGLSEIADGDTKIVLVGLDKKQAETIPKNILGIERTGNAKELAEIYTAADVLFNPTYADNYPTVNLEAQACGTPVITYATGGSVENVPQENVVAQGDIEGFWEKFKKPMTIGKIDIDAKRRFIDEYTKLYEE